MTGFGSGRQSDLETSTHNRIIIPAFGLLGRYAPGYLMDADRLIELLKRGEGDSIEFKESLPCNATQIAQILASFSNSHGGILLIGVTDDGKIAGVSDRDAVQQRLASISQAICRPPLVDVTMGSVQVGTEEHVVWMTVAPSRRGLCLVEGKCYIRVGPTSLPITSSEQLEAVLRQRLSPLPEATYLTDDHVVGLRFADPDLGFRDRVQQLSEMRKLVEEQRSVKLVVLLGPGGIGKTALLSKLCQEIEKGELRLFDAPQPSGADGLLYYSCRGTDMPSVGRLFNDVARVLDGTSAEELMECWRDGSRSLTDKMTFLLSKLRSGCYFMVLDNLENLLDSNNRFKNSDMRGFLELTLTTAHSLRILATGRVKPDFGGPHIRAVRTITLDSGLPDQESLALLRELDPAGELGIRDASGEILLHAVRRCCGIPRALEVLVGILHSVPSISLKDLLNNDSLFRQHVVESLVASHYSSLSTDQRRIVEALALLNKPVPAVAVAYLLSAFFPELSAADCLADLTRHYLVRYQRAFGLYSLHPFDQEHAYGRIPNEQGAYNRKALHRRAAQYYLEVVGRPPSLCNELSDLEPQFSAFLHFRNAHDGDSACQVLDSIDPLPLSVWGHYGLIVEMRESIREIQAEGCRKAGNLGSLGRAYANMGDTCRAIDCYTQSLELARRACDTPQVAMRIGNLGEAYFVLGDTEKALALFQEANREFDRLGAKKEAGFWLGHIGLAYVRLGRFDEAVRHFRTAVEIGRCTGDEREGSWLSNLGALFLASGEPEVALEYYQRSVDMARVANDRRGLVARLRGVGNCLFRLSRADEAITSYAESLKIAQAIGSRFGQASTLLCLGKACCNLGRLREAEDSLKESLAIRSPSTAFESSVQLGIVDLLCNRPVEAEKHFRDGITSCIERLAKTPNDYAAAYFLALGQVGLGDFSAARRQFRLALQICSGKGVLHDVLGDLELLRRVNPFVEEIPGLAAELSLSLSGATLSKKTTEGGATA